MQNCFLTQYVLKPPRRGNVLGLVFSSQHELVLLLILIYVSLLVSSSVLTKEDIRSLALSGRKCESDESNHLGQLFVTHELISNTLR